MFFFLPCSLRTLCRALQYAATNPHQSALRSIYEVSAYMHTLIYVLVSFISQNGLVGSLSQEDIDDNKDVIGKWNFTIMLLFRDYAKSLCLEDEV